MCGVVGYAYQRPAPEEEWLASGRDAMRHRGPDDAGIWFSPDRRVGLGHRRLSIIDLTPAGHQPMADASGRLSIVFNGEIYNFADLRRELAARGYAFRSGTDTEVILAAYAQWGTDCVARLNGMFVFALYDETNRRLFLARDRAGEKPLFYAAEPGRFRFASELKGLFADKTRTWRIDPVGLDCYLAMGYVPGDGCIIGGVRKLPPAHALVFDLGSGETRVWRYWELPPFNGAAVADETQLLDELEALVEDAVRRQLVADVPVGVLLSGGVDSSIVTAMAVRASSNVKTFTVRFPGYADYDETEHARLIAQHFGTHHVELDAGTLDQALLPMLARQFDEPIVDSSMLPTYLVTRLVREHCTVALGGDGGDELFAGYMQYNRLLWLQQRLGAIPHSVRAPIGWVSQRVLPVGFKGRNWLQELALDLRDGLPTIATYFDQPMRRALVPRALASPSAEEIRKRRTPRTPDLLQRATRADFENYLPEDVLVKVDRASMLNSLEVRAPLLDYRIVEFAFGKVPSRLKAETGTRKVLLKKLAGRLLPPAFDRNRKQGFSIPLARWLREGEWYEFFRDVLLGSRHALFDPKTVEGLLRGHQKGHSNSERLFALVLFQLWRDAYGVSL